MSVKQNKKGIEFFMKATVIQNVSNQYKVVDEKDNIHICTARGKLKINTQVLNKKRYFPVWRISFLFMVQ